MNNYLRFYLISSALILALLPSLAFGEGAQARPVKLPTGLDEAIAVALENRVEVALESQKLVSAEKEVNVARGKFWPRLYLSGSSNYVNYIDKFTGVEANIALGGQRYRVTMQNDPPSYETIAGLNLSYSLYAGGRDIACLKEKKAEFDAQKYQELEVKREISQEVVNAYWSLRKSQLLSRIAERNHRHAQKKYAITQTKKAAELISAIEGETEALSLKEAEFALINARRNETRNLHKYQEILGIDPASRTAPDPASVLLTDDPDLVSNAPLPPPTDRPETLRLQAELLAAKNRVKESEADYLPQIDLITSYKMVGRDDSDYFRSTELKADDYLVGLSFSFTLLDGLKDRVALARSEEKIANLQILENIQKLTTENNDKAAEIEELAEKINLATQRLKLSELKLQQARKKHSHGEIAEIDLNEAEKNVEELSDKLMISKIKAAVARQTDKVGDVVD